MPEPIVVPVEPSIDVPPSADNGNLPVDAPIAPNPEPQTPAAAAPAEPTTPPAEPVAGELYELPDGRKVDGATLTKEWKENFLPEFTRKSQTLAAIEKNIAPPVVPQDNKPTNPLADPNFVPQTYEELAKVIRESTIAELEGREAAKVAERQAIEDNVSAQLTEIKAADPNLNESALFHHATKYRFTDLRLAHQNMRDMAQVVKETKQATAKDINKRNDPVSINPGAMGATPDSSSFSSARDFLRSLNG